MKDVCVICGRKIINGREYSCNGAVVGALINIRGHPVCVDNVENLVVIPNQMRVESLTRDQKEQESWK